MITLQTPIRAATVAASLLVAGACGAANEQAARDTSAAHLPQGTARIVSDTVLPLTFEAAGVAEPIQQATVSTKLMGTVNAVLAQEGQLVRSGQPLIRIDARELDAKTLQVAASVADAAAMQQEASRHAARFTALYQDSAATRAQYEAALTGLARADAGLRAARAGASELEAVRSYATVRAPFSGMITTRLVDAGSFAAPGAPLLTLQDISSLRLSVTVPSDVARHVTRGASVMAHIDGDTATVRVEGVIPSGTGSVYTVNALLPNPRHTYRAGSAVTLNLSLGTRRGLAVPLASIVRDGDLVGVIVREASGDARRWVRLGTPVGNLVEVTSGLRAGESIVVPIAASGSASGARSGGI